MHNSNKIHKKNIRTEANGPIISEAELVNYFISKGFNPMHKLSVCVGSKVKANYYAMEGYNHSENTHVEISKEAFEYAVECFLAIRKIKNCFAVNFKYGGQNLSIGGLSIEAANTEVRKQKKLGSTSIKLYS